MSKIAKFFIASEDNDFHPGALSYRAFLIYAGLLLLLRLFIGATLASGSAVESGGLMNFINQERTARNLTALNIDPRLIAAATGKSQDMIDRDYFAHIDPDGNYVWGRIIAAGYSKYRILGENLAVDFATSEGIIKAWLDSPTHRANLLHPDFVDQGLSALYGDFQGRYTNLTASLFGAPPTPAKAPSPPAPLPPSPSPKPSPAPPPPAPLPAREPTTAPNPSNIRQARQESASTSANTTTPSFKSSQGKSTVANFRNAFLWSKLLFTIFGIFLLIILATDSVIIYWHELSVARSESSYHLFSFIIITLVSILIWWW